MSNREFITEDEVDRALDWLRDNADEAAAATADRIYVQEYRKSLKAIIMKEHEGLPLGAQEREAYADRRYIDYLDAIRQAVFNDVKLDFLKSAADAKVKAWQTYSANSRGRM